MAPADTSQAPTPGAAEAADQAPAPEPALGFLLGSTHRALRSAWEASLSDLAVTGPQALLLRAIAARPGCGLRELARQLRTDAMNAKRLADGLEQAELVRSHTDPHHRQRRCLALTDRGQHVTATVRDRARDWDRALEARLGRSRLAALRSLLTDLDRVLAEGMDASAASDAPQPTPEEDPA